MKPPKRSRLFSVHGAAVLALACGQWLALPAPARAATEEPDREAVIYRLEHVGTDDLRQILHMMNVRFTPQQQLGAIVVYEPPERQLAVREVIAALDVAPEPRRDLELRISILEASRAEGEADVGGSLARVAAELAQAFGYRGFRVLDSIVLRVSNGSRGGVEGGISFGSLEHQLGYRLGFREAALVRAGDETSVRLEGFEFRAYELVGEQAVDRAAFGTDVEMAAGQTAVVGKATPWRQDATVVLVVDAVALP